MKSTDTIAPAINDALAKHWIAYYRPPESIRVHPADAAELTNSWFAEQDRTNADIEVYWLETGARYRRELHDAHDRIAGGVGISHWVDSYAGGVSVPLIVDASVPRGTVQLSGDA